MKRVLQSLLLLGLFSAASAHAADLYKPNNWSALSSDRIANKLGDMLTVVIYESATASNSVNTNAKKSTSFGGGVTAGTSLVPGSSFDQAGNLSLNNQSDNSGSMGRSGGMVAEISVVVDDVYPNGDLHVIGAQQLNIDGEETNIRIKGRVRPADISASNAVLSTRLANAMIDYDGSGFVSRSGDPGIVSRIFNWLELP
jgi:flagellar L-ring protein precursor FlgH